MTLTNLKQAVHLSLFARRCASIGVCLIGLVPSLFLLAGCNFTRVTPQIDIQGTEAAASLEARLTEVMAIFTQIAQVVSATSTPLPTSTATPTVTPTPYYTLTETLRPVFQDSARFVMDVTIPDRTKYLRGTSFTKTWRLLNIGLSTWTSEFALVYVSGDRMSGAREILLKGSVQPGYMIDLSVGLVAPELNGDYRG